MFAKNELKDFILQLSNSGISDVNAYVSIYVYFERYAKPLDELPEIIYLIAPNLLSPQKVQSAISWMVDNHLAEIKGHQGLGKNVLRVADDFPEKIEQMTRIKDIAQKLKNTYINSEPKMHVQPLGIVGRGQDNYARLLNNIKNARKSVKYAILTTEPYDSTAEVLENVARKGVKIQLLIANDKIATSYKQKKSVEKKWRERFNDVPNVVIKVFEDESVTELCTSVLIDNRSLHVVFYDPKLTRSLDGFLIEAENRLNEDLNIIKWFREKFDNAWDNTYSSKRDQWLSKVCSPTSLASVALFISLMCYSLCSLNEMLSELLLVIIGGLGGYVLQKIYIWGSSKLKILFRAIKSMR